MSFNPISMLAVVCIVVGFAGLIYGVTGGSDARRNLGLRLLQGGMTLGGLLLITNSFTLGPQDDIYSGLMLLLFGTGATAINPGKQE